MKPLYHGIAVFLCGSWVFASIQNGSASPTTTSLSQVASQAGQQEPEQLRQLVTAIALYPDALLGQMMAAATYPREVIEAEQWMLQHQGLTGDAVAKEVDKQSWDSSVKALSHFPLVLANMSLNLAWTSELGIAYVNQRQELTKAIQTMRHEAVNAGNSRSTTREKVATKGDTFYVKPAPDLSINCEESLFCYPWKIAIVSTVFWVGETGSGPANTRSAWDGNWVSSYGGVDDPVQRRGYEPARFRPLENPFYVALPYCDMQAGRLKAEAAKVVPWFSTRFRVVGQSVCKGSWLEIRHGLKSCYAQWEDVGPFHTNSATYVFGGEGPSPNGNHRAGIDVSPAVRDYLGLGSVDVVDWRFVERSEVAVGPWSLYDSLQQAG
jgi:Protein of unknown function (DUF3300)